MNAVDDVVIVCDWRGAEDAHALRAVLEYFRVRVHLYRMVQRGEALAFLAGARPECDYLVLGAHGTGSDEEPRIHFEVVDQASGDARAIDGWEHVGLDLTPASIPELVSGGRGTVIAAGCGAGRTPLANALLEAGFDAVIGPTEPYVDADSALLFMIGFFYFVLAADRDLAPRSYSVEEAVKRAAQLDPDFRHGTLSYRYYCSHVADHRV